VLSSGSVASDADAEMAGSLGLGRLAGLFSAGSDVFFFHSSVACVGAAIRVLLRHWNDDASDWMASRTDAGEDFTRSFCGRTSGGLRVLCAGPCGDDFGLPLDARFT
jgi:hypothetical protein